MPLNTFGNIFNISEQRILFYGKKCRIYLVTAIYGHTLHYRIVARYGINVRCTFFWNSRHFTTKELV